MAKQNLKTLLTLKARNNKKSTEDLDTKKSIADPEISEFLRFIRF
jgi:hypothetical protein